MLTEHTHLPNPILYALIRGVVRLMLKLLTRTQILGQENLPPGGAFITASNHLSMLDAPLIMAAVPARITVFAAHTHRHEFFVGTLMSALGAIWVRRGEADREAIRAALQVLRQGGVIGAAPEGTRSKTRALQQGKIGPAYLATRAGVPIVPIALIGTEAGLKGVFTLRRPRLTVIVGAPLALPGATPNASKQQLEQYTDLVMQTLAGMLPEKYRGVYGGAAQGK